MKILKEIDKIIKELSLEEKIRLMSGSRNKSEIIESIQKKRIEHYNETPYRAGGIEEKGIPPILFVDGTRGVVCGREIYTCFPVEIMRGASFDVELEKRIGEAIAEEVIEAGGNLFAGICINLPYHPGWGRCQETYGEDSYLLGEMGAALVEGIQKRGVIACIKHFAFNSMENSRVKVNIVCDKRTEREVFLPHFKKCIEAGAGAVMSSYNYYMGVPCGHHKYLLRKVLKKEWGFQGFVMSDFIWGIKDTIDAVTGGQDIEMPSTIYYGEELLHAVKKGVVKEEVIDEAVTRILRTLFYWKKKRERYQIKQVNLKKHIELSLESAREGITLIQNKNNILPLSTHKKKEKIAVLGYLANKENTGDKGSSQVYPPYVVTPLEGIIKIAKNAEIIYYDGKSISHCKRLANEADIVIIFAGYDYRDEGEFVKPDENDILEKVGGDRKNSLGLNKRDIDVIDGVASIRKDSIVVLLGGSMILMKEWKEKVGAILLSYYPGMEGGTAIGEVLFGKVNPSGKLPFTIVEREEDLPSINWETEKQVYEYYNGYRLMDKNNIKPLFPFGFGMSYTSFSLGKLNIWIENGRLYASVWIKNCGKRRGIEVIQMYVGFPKSKVERPKKVLKGFQRVELEKAEQKKVTISCELQDLAWYNEEEEKFIVEYTIYDVYVGTSSSTKDLIRKSIELKKL